MDEVFLRIVWGETAVNEFMEGVPRIMRASDDLYGFDYEEASGLLAELCQLAGLVGAARGMTLPTLVDLVVAILGELKQNEFIIAPHYVTIGVRQLLIGVVSVNTFGRWMGR